MRELIGATDEPWFPAVKKFSGNPAMRELSVKDLYNVSDSLQLLLSWTLRDLC
jgi:hypothetical protein